jgi:hypothetical protein
MNEIPETTIETEAQKAHREKIAQEWAEQMQKQFEIEAKEKEREKELLLVSAYPKFTRRIIALEKQIAAGVNVEATRRRLNQLQKRVFRKGEQHAST